MCKYIDELQKVNYTKNKINAIAKKYGLKLSELKKYYQTKFFSDISKAVNLDNLSKLNSYAIYLYNLLRVFAYDVNLGLIKLHYGKIMGMYNLILNLVLVK